MTSLSLKMVEALRGVIGSKPVPLHEPRLLENEKRYLADCIDSGFVSSVGPYVQAFEESLANLTGAKRVVAVSSGTAALQIALRVAGVKAGDEVLVPSLSFVATANAVSYIGAAPHFVDVEEETLGVNPDALREWLSLTAMRSDQGLVNKISGRVIRALVPMHTFGHPSRIDALCEVAGDFGIVVVEDAAESLGSTFRGKHTGTFGRLGSISFNGNKIVTTGGGGAILTDDSKLADYAKHLSTTAKEPHGWEYVHDEIGYNFRMPNINAALGVAQLEQLPGFLASKRLLGTKYQEAFSAIEGVSLVTEPDDAQSNYWLQTVLLSDEVSGQRDEILQTLNASGFGARPVWRPLHLLPIYEGAHRASLPVTEKLGRSLINLPSSSGLV